MRKTEKGEKREKREKREKEGDVREKAGEKICEEKGGGAERMRWERVNMNASSPTHTHTYHHPPHVLFVRGADVPLSHHVSHRPHRRLFAQGGYITRRISGEKGTGRKEKRKGGKGERKGGGEEPLRSNVGR